VSTAAHVAIPEGHSFNSAHGYRFPL